MQRTGQKLQRLFQNAQETALQDISKVINSLTLDKHFIFAIILNIRSK